MLFSQMRRQVSRLRVRFSTILAYACPPMFRIQMTRDMRQKRFLIGETFVAAINRSFLNGYIVEADFLLNPGEVIVLF